VKTPQLILLLGLVTGIRCPGQIGITGFCADGTLCWTNRLSTAQPVYEVLSASAVTGQWAHVAFVTNQTATVVTNPPGGAVFYRVAWVDGAPLVFDYSFDEGYGCAAVTGRLTLTLWSKSEPGAWGFGPSECYLNRGHPVGVGRVGLPRLEGDRLQLYLTAPIEGGVFLDGLLEQTNTVAGCVLVGYAGTAFQVLLSGDAVSIGTFVAVPVAQPGSGPGQKRLRPKHRTKQEL
jgi:hypothetical protein